MKLTRLTREKAVEQITRRRNLRDDTEVFVFDASDQLGGFFNSVRTRRQRTRAAEGI
jgi:hypothetical protein